MANLAGLRDVNEAYCTTAQARRAHTAPTVAR
jgi:hypothetical protein